MEFKNMLASWRLGRSKIIKEGTWIVVGQVISAMGLFALVRLLTETLDPVKYGDLALALTLAMLISQCAMSGVIPGVMRFYPIAVEQHDVQGYFRASVSLIFLGTVAAIILLFFVELVLHFWGRAELSVPVVFGFVFTQLGSVGTAFNSIQNAARQRRVVACHAILEVVLRFSICWVALIFFGETPIVVISSYIVALAITLISQWCFVKNLICSNKSHANSKKTNWIMRMWAFSRPFSLINFFTWAQSNSDRWSVDRFSNTYGVGLLSALLQVGYTPINIAIGLLTTLVAPILNQRSGDAKDAGRNAEVARLSQKLLVVSLIATAVATIVAFLLHEWLFRFLVGEAFRGVSGFLPWVVLAGGLFASGQIIATRLMSDLRTYDLLRPKVITAIIGVSLNIVGAYWFGVGGVVIASVIFSALHLGWLFYLAVGTRSGTK